MKIFKFIKYIPLIIINYFLLFFLIYIISGYLLLRGITPDLKLINTYQVNFYLEAVRNIWQNNSECVEFDKDLIYVPKLKNCSFKNIEFDTNISFDRLGRVSNHPNEEKNKKKSIAVIGDSFAMGWGVNDNETFASILENKINKNVYNLAVSSYGTKRELIRLQKSGLLDQVDTVIIQYCYNDFGENNSFVINSEINSKEKFQKVTSSQPNSNWRKLRRTFRYSVQIPIDLVKKKPNSLDFLPHQNLLLSLLNEYPLIMSKKIYIFYTNGPNLNFSNFPNGKLLDNDNIYFLDIKLKNDHYFKIDGHLNKTGHKFIAKELSKVIK